MKRVFRFRVVMYNKDFQDIQVLPCLKWAILRKPWKKNTCWSSLDFFMKVWCRQHLFCPDTSTSRQIGKTDVMPSFQILA